MNRDTLEALVRAHQAELYRYVRYLGAADRAEAEDLVQETFLAALRSREGPRATEERGQAAWLRGIARHLFLAYCRQKRRGPQPLDEANLERAETFWATEYLRDGDGSDYLLALRRCLDLLDEKKRRLLDLRYREGLSRTEMARQCQVSEEGIKSALQRLRAMLADCVHRRLDREGGRP